MFLSSARKTNLCTRSFRDSCPKREEQGLPAGEPILRQKKYLFF